MARGVGFEPTTNALTAHCSAAELPPNIFIEPFPPLTTFEKIFTFSCFGPGKKILGVNKNKWTIQLGPLVRTGIMFDKAFVRFF